MLTETYISVWDVRRPYIPEGFFTEHKETIGGRSPEGHTLHQITYALALNHQGGVKAFVQPIRFERGNASNTVDRKSPGTTDQ